MATSKWYKAKEVFLTACMKEPSATTWLGLGIACLNRDEVTQVRVEMCMCIRVWQNVHAYVCLIPVVCARKPRYVCACVHIHTRTHMVQTYRFVHTSAHAYTYTLVHTLAHAYTYKLQHRHKAGSLLGRSVRMIGTFIRAYMDAYIHIFQAFMYVYIYIYIHIHIYTYICIHTRIFICFERPLVLVYVQYVYIYIYMYVCMYVCTCV